MATTIVKPSGPVELPGQESTRALATPHTRAIPRKLTELGRIRIGDREPNKNGKGTHPHKLAQFRLTSSNKPLLEYAARHPDIGGSVREWADAPGEGRQWELYTESDALDVIIPTFSAVSLNYERWSLAGCEQRCTGEVITHCGRKEELIGTPCLCPADDQERASQAQDGKACARILRLNVLLPDLPGTGFWRLDTKGFYATAELMGTLALLQEAGAEHVMIEAVLRLEQRTTKKVGPGGGTLHYAVPVIWPKYTFRQIAAAKEAQQALLMAPPVAPTPALLASRAAQAADDLYGDGAGDIFRKDAPPHSSGASGLDTVPQLEALVLANGGTLETFWPWAERQMKKPQAQFGEEEYGELLRRAQAQAAVRRAEQAQKAAMEGQAETSTAGATAETSDAPAGNLEPVSGLADEFANVDPETGEVFDLHASAALDRQLAREMSDADEPF